LKWQLRGILLDKQITKRSEKAGRMKEALDELRRTAMETYIMLKLFNN
jgi:hypothetical protein